MKSFTILLLLSLSYGTTIGQSSDTSLSRFVFLPSGLHFTPLKANIQEPRIGVFKFLNSSDMKVDIGNSIDVFGLEVPSSKLRFTAGIDFMAYAFTTGAQGLRLQIDAIDGFFGGNLTASKTFVDENVQARLRILHHSAHMVDGHYNQHTNSWMDNREPIPFTRDFGELVFAHNFTASVGIVRYYGGVSYATLVRPVTVERLAYLAGGEVYFDKLLGNLQNQPVNLYLTYNLALMGTPAYWASNQIQLGMKFGTWDKKGTSIYIAYYSGRHMFAEYFDISLTTIGAGFTVDFF